MSGEGIRNLKLFHYPATRSARVKWILHEVVGEAFTTEPLDLYAGVQYSDEFMAKNPNHNVPVLDVEFDDGSHMTQLESAAMVAFLADAYPDKQLAPPPGPSRARGYGLCQDEVFRAYLSRISKRPAFRAAFADAASFNPQPPKVPGGKVSFNG